jgi:hypothetical protein
MIFKRRNPFFLDLTKSGSKPGEEATAGAASKSAAVESAAPGSPADSEPAERPSQAPAQPMAVTPSPQPQAAPAAPAEQPPTPAAAAAPAAQPVLTTAEAIAAELRAAQEAQPAPSNVTFAPECLNPANAVPTRRRRAGANLGVFKGMVDEMFRS